MTARNLTAAVLLLVICAGCGGSPVGPTSLPPTASPVAQIIYQLRGTGVIDSGRMLHYVDDEGERRFPGTPVVFPWQVELTITPPARLSLMAYDNNTIGDGCVIGEIWVRGILVAMDTECEVSSDGIRTTIVTYVLDN